MGASVYLVLRRVPVMTSTWFAFIECDERRNGMVVSKQNDHWRQHYGYSAPVKVDPLVF